MVSMQMKWLFVLMLLGLAPSVHAERLRIEIGGANFRPFPVAAPVLTADGNLTKKEKK